MKIAISGASGLIGTQLKQAFEGAGHTVISIIRDRSKQGANTILWDPESHFIEGDKLEGIDAVVNLAGEGIATGRWNEEKKRKILESRVDSTKTLSDCISHLKQPPKVFINGSAIGYYGDRGDLECTEKTSRGKGFLADVCAQWEEAALPAVKAGVRTIFLRTGIVLSKDGGALGKMLLPFKLGLGGVIGSGKQYMSWITIDDLVGMILYMVVNTDIDGPVNGVAPNPVTNREFTKTLGAVLHRPTIFPVPAFVLRVLLGKEMADEFLLASTRVRADKILEKGYRFKYPNLHDALNHVIYP